MKKLAIAALVVASFLLGALIGSQSTSRIWASQMEGVLLTGALSEIHNAYIPLRELTVGRSSNAVSLLRIQLDGALISRAVLCEVFGHDDSETDLVARARLLQQSLIESEAAEP